MKHQSQEVKYLVRLVVWYAPYNWSHVIGILSKFLLLLLVHYIYRLHSGKVYFMQRLIVINNTLLSLLSAENENIVFPL